MGQVACPSNGGWRSHGGCLPTSWPHLLTVRCEKGFFLSVLREEIQPGIGGRKSPYWYSAVSFFHPLPSHCCFICDLRAYEAFSGVLRVAVAESAAVRASSFWLRVRIAEGSCPRGATRVARRARASVRNGFEMRQKTILDLPVPNQCNQEVPLCRRSHEALRCSRLARTIRIAYVIQIYHDRTTREQKSEKR